MLRVLYVQRSDLSHSRLTHSAEQRSPLLSSASQSPVVAAAPDWRRASALSCDWANRPRGSLVVSQPLFLQHETRQEEKRGSVGWGGGFRHGVTEQQTSRKVIGRTNRKWQNRKNVFCKSSLVLEGRGEDTTHPVLVWQNQTALFIQCSNRLMANSSPASHEPWYVLTY